MARKTKITSNWFTSTNSPTYKATLWLIDQDVWRSPTDIGDPAKRATFVQNGKAVIIAESGVTTSYTIDNIIIQSKVNSSKSDGNTTVGIVQFELTEPMGFKLLDRLISYSEIQKFGTIQEACYLLQVEFQGLDPNTGHPIKYPGIYYMPIKIQEMRASLGPQGSVYSVVCNNFIKTALIESTVETEFTLSGVYKLSNLVSTLNKKLNDIEQDLRGRAGKSKKTWNVRFDKTATIAAGDGIPGFDLTTAQYSGTTDSDKASAGNVSKDDKDKRDTKANNSTNMVSWIKQEINKNVPAWGKYVKQFTDNPKSKKTPSITVTPGIEYKDEIDPETNQRAQEVYIDIGVKWNYNVPAPDPKSMDTKLNDKQFQIQRFHDLPISKVYDYLYTGQNTEVLNYEINFNHLFAIARDPYKGKFYANPAQASMGSNPVIAERMGLKNPIVPVSDRIGADAIEKNRSNFNYLADTQVSQTKLAATVKPIYQFAVSASADQQSNEILGDNIGLDTMANDELANRDDDMYQIDIDIVGDPFWMGAPGSLQAGERMDSLSDYITETAMIAIRNYYPDESMLYSEDAKKGEMDLLASGVYAIVEIETRLRRGEFTQTLSGHKDTNTSTYFIKDELERLKRLY